VIEAWIHLFIDWDLIKTEGGKSNWNMSVFIRSTPIFSKDKPGNNAAIQILKFLYLFQQKQYNEMLDINTTLKLYAHRYLKNKHNMRIYFVIRTLCALVDEGLDKRIGIPKATIYLEKLKLYPTDFLEQRTVEIAPFDVVIKEIFKRL
jgi:hypothetical protein